ncbi:MAG: hypothetical protein AAGH67_08950, partial [Cyanobacteria bacterium P01_H01_bin.162]
SDEIIPELIIYDAHTKAVSHQDVLAIPSTNVLWTFQDFVCVIKVTEAHLIGPAAMHPIIWMV